MTESRLIRLIRRIVEEITAPTKYYGIYRYRVVTQVLNRFTLQALTKNVPDLVPCKARPGMPGAKADLALGSEVLVAFEDGSEQRPVIIAYADASDGGFVPTKSSIDADTQIDLGPAAGYVIRDGDIVNINPGNGSGPVAGTISVTTPIAPQKVKA